MSLVACVGAGYWGRNVVRNFRDLGVLGAVCDPDRDVLARVADDCPGVRMTTSVEDVLRDPAIVAVAIATPAQTHGALVRQALLAGKHVFVEEPLCLSVVEGRELVALAEQSSLLLMVGHLLWYHPAVLALKELIEATRSDPVHLFQPVESGTHPARGEHPLVLRAPRHLRGAGPRRRDAPHRHGARRQLSAQPHHRRDHEPAGVPERRQGARLRVVAPPVQGAEARRRGRPADGGLR